MRKSIESKISVENPLIAYGAKISRIGGGVKIAKSNGKYRHFGKISIFLQGRLK
jgi:hypothetical protein